MSLFPTGEMLRSAKPRDDVLPEGDSPQNIEDILREVWDRPPPEKRAAERLLLAGVGYQGLWEFSRTVRAMQLPSHWVNNTLNELRRQERR